MPRRDHYDENGKYIGYDDDGETREAEMAGVGIIIGIGIIIAIIGFILFVIGFILKMAATILFSPGFILLSLINTGQPIVGWICWLIVVGFSILIYLIEFIVCSVKRNSEFSLFVIGGTIILCAVAYFIFCTSRLPWSGAWNLLI